LLADLLSALKGGGSRVKGYTTLRELLSCVKKSEHKNFLSAQSLTLSSLPWTAKLSVFVKKIKTAFTSQISLPAACHPPARSHNLLVNPGYKIFW